jgi:hypothetical protein
MLKQKSANIKSKSEDYKKQFGFLEFAAETDNLGRENVGGFHDRLGGLLPTEASAHRLPSVLPGDVRLGGDTRGGCGGGVGDQMKLTFGSLFAGIGGFDLGLERAGMECRWQVEIDPFCRKVLEKHWPGVPKYGDIREIKGPELERVDLICGGFPCQDISKVNRCATGIEGERTGPTNAPYRSRGSTTVRTHGERGSVAFKKQRDGRSSRQLGRVRV